MAKIAGAYTVDADGNDHLFNYDLLNRKTGGSSQANPVRGQAQPVIAQVVGLRGIMPRPRLLSLVVCTLSPSLGVILAFVADQLPSSTP